MSTAAAHAARPLSAAGPWRRPPPRPGARKGTTTRWNCSPRCPWAAGRLPPGLSHAAGAAAAAAAAAAADGGTTLTSTDILLAEVGGSAGTLAEIAATADLTTQVPTCPDWTLRQLITHVGRAHRWAAAIVATRAAEPIPFREVPDGRLPDDPAARPAWLRDGAARLAEAVSTGTGAGPVWTHLGPGPASYWARRMAHETAVHRADGQIAVGTRPVIDPV